MHYQHTSMNELHVLSARYARLQPASAVAEREVMYSIRGDLRLACCKPKVAERNPCFMLSWLCSAGSQVLLLLLTSHSSENDHWADYTNTIIISLVAFSSVVLTARPPPFRTPSLLSHNHPPPNLTDNPREEQSYCCMLKALPGCFAVQMLQVVVVALAQDWVGAGVQHGAASTSLLMLSLSQRRAAQSHIGWRSYSSSSGSKSMRSHTSSKPAPFMRTFAQCIGAYICGLGTRS